MSENLSRKFFFKEGIWKTHKPSIEEIITAIKETDPESEFGKNIGDLKYAPDKEIERNLTLFPPQNYEALMIYFSNGKNLGHIAFQKKDNPKYKEWHVFQWYILPEHRKHGHAYNLALEMIKEAEQNQVYKLRAGKPKSHAINEKLLGMLDERSEDLGIEVDFNTNFITIPKYAKTPKELV